MSQENVEIVRAAFDAFSRGDMETLLGLMDPEIVVMQPPEVPDGTTLHGHAGVLEAIAAWPDQWDDYQLEIVQIVDAGSHVAVKTHQRGRGKGSGVAVEDEIWFVTGFRNGKVVEWRMFGAESQALEAAGAVGGLRSGSTEPPGRANASSISLSGEGTKRLDHATRRPA